MLIGRDKATADSGMEVGGVEAIGTKLIELYFRSTSRLSSSSLLTFFIK